MLNPGARITHYRLHWNANSKTGHIVLIEMGTGQTYDLQGLDYSNYMALVDMLRHERPIFFDVATGTLLTGPEMVGEDEE